MVNYLDLDTINKRTNEIFIGGMGPTGKAEAVKTLYTTTSKEAAKIIAETGILKGSAQEAGQVFATTIQPTLSQATQTGARSLETVIKFDAPSIGWMTDKTVAERLQSISVKSNGPINITNVSEVGFKKVWYKPWTWFN